MRETILLIAAVIGLGAAVLSLIKAIIELKAAKAKNQPPIVATAAVKAEPAGAGNAATSQIPEIVAIRKLIDKTWTGVSWALGGAMFSFVLSFVVGLHPDMRGFWWEVVSSGMIACSFAYAGIAFVMGRRAVKLHEALGSLEIIELVPLMLARYRQSIREREQQ